MTAPIWRPDPETAANSSIARFGRFVSGRTGAEFGGYLDLWRWSERRRAARDW